MTLLGPARPAPARALTPRPRWKLARPTTTTLSLGPTEPVKSLKYFDLGQKFLHHRNPRRDGLQNNVITVAFEVAPLLKRP